MTVAVYPETCSEFIKAVVYTFPIPFDLDFKLNSELIYFGLFAQQGDIFLVREQILSSFTHLHVPNSYDFLSSAEHKENVFKSFGIQTTFDPIDFLFCFIFFKISSFVFHRRKEVIIGIT